MTAPGQTVGVLAALPRELGTLAERAVGRRSVTGVEVLELGPIDGVAAGARLLACVGGIGKARGAHGAAALLAAGVDRALLVVGTCGGLRRHLGPGTLVHCTTAVQADLAVREGREVAADSDLRAAWSAVVPGESGWFLTADRPVLTPWRRLRLARAFAGPCVADMETAAAAAVAARAGVPWAALRAVTDVPGWTGPVGSGSFRKHFPTQAGRAADSVPDLLAALLP